MQQELQAYIRNTQGQGYSSEQIRGQLLQAGWPLLTVDQVLPLSSTGASHPASISGDNSFLGRSLCLLSLLLALALAVLVTRGYFA